MNPRVARPKAFLTSVRARPNVVDLIGVTAPVAHAVPLCLLISLGANERSPCLFPEDVPQKAAVLGLVQLHEDEPLPASEQRLTRGHRNCMRRPSENHLSDVRTAVRPFVRYEVLSPATKVVVREIAVRDQPAEMASEVVECAVLPLVDQQSAGGVPAICDRAALGDPRILDRPQQLVRNVEKRPTRLR